MAATLNSTVPLNGIPDKLIIFVREFPSLLLTHETDNCATFKRHISEFQRPSWSPELHMTPEQLFRDSVQSGLTNMSWEDFSGAVMSVRGSYNPDSGVIVNGSYSPDPGVIVKAGIRDSHAGVCPQA